MTSREPVAFFDTIKSANNIAQPAAAKKAEKILLAEDETADQMVYYDKSSCMHAPKAN